MVSFSRLVKAGKSSIEVLMDSGCPSTGFTDIAVYVDVSKHLVMELTLAETVAPEKGARYRNFHFFKLAENPGCFDKD